MTFTPELIAQAQAIYARENDTPDGFEQFFELMHGTPLRPGAKAWVEKAYEAHAQKKGFANEVHREGSKTTIFGKFFLLFRIGHEPEKANMIIRINGNKANETTNAVATIIEHDPKWKIAFPHVEPDKEKGWGANGYYVKRTDISYNEWVSIRTREDDYPTFVGHGWNSGSIVGSRVSGVLLVDDIHDTQNVKSEADLSSIKDLVTEVLEYTIKDGAWEIWNYTPYAFNDIYQFIKSTGEYVHNLAPVMVPAEEGDAGAEMWPEDERVPLSGNYWKLSWPEYWGFERLAKKYKKTGQIKFARQMLLDLEAMKGNKLRQEWLHYYDSTKVDPSWPVFMGIDYASVSDKSKIQKRDYFALSVYRGIPGGGIILMGGLRAHLTKTEGLKAIASHSAIFPTLQLIGVESLGKGEEFYNDALLMRDIQGRPYPLMQVKHGKKSKGERFEDWLAPRFESGRIWISDAPDPFLAEFENEWLLWDKAQHDDCLDAAYMGAVAAEGQLYDKSRTFRSREKKPNPLFGFGRR